MNTFRKSLGTLFPAMRISFALVMITSCILLSAEMLGFTPAEEKFMLDARTKISESLAIQLAVLAPEQDIKKIQKLMRYVVKRNHDILSAGIRLKSGQLVFQSNNHDELWQGYNSDLSTSTHVIVPLQQNGRLWGKVEFRFEQLKGESIMGFFQKPIFKTAIFMLIIGFFVYLIFMLRTLRQLDPSSVIPERVNAAFDTLSEGVIIIDENEQILLTNRVFSEKIGQSAESLLGIKVSELKWERLSVKKSGAELPWIHVLETGKSAIGVQLKINAANGKTLKFVLNVSPINSGGNRAQGVLITLDDITELEERNTELQTIVFQLEQTQDQIQQQNKELNYLATRDPMTGCLNRRSFSEQFQKLFNKASKEKSELSCLMIDLDHFKLVNDNYGHATGDVVIKLLGEILKSHTRKFDLVGRYGGEEFCLVLPGQTTDEAFTVAERIRLRIKSESSKRFEGGPRVTASIGIAGIFDNPENPDALNNLADQALYVAKESGRNRVVRWSAEPEAQPISESIEIMPQQAESFQVESLQTRIDELENIASQFSAELEHSKSYDTLTGLPNQVLFYDRIQQSIERGFRLDQLAAVLVIDIEMFSQVNATMGRLVGDHLLQEVAARLKSVFRKTDGISRLTVSRFGGDEFAVLLTDLSQEEQATWAVKRLLDAINRPAEIDGNMIYLSCRVGVSLYPTDANTVDELLNNAMTAKQYGKKHQMEIKYQFYDKHMQDLSIKHLLLDKELRQAIKEDHWQLLYQPKLDIKLGKIVGAEALIRWNHPHRGLLSPYEFIDFAEQHGLIIPIGDWVIKQACRQIRAWIDQGFHDCKIAINLSSVQLMQPDIVTNIFKALDSYKVPPRLFEVEITETTLMDNIKTAIDSLRRLHSRGINISIDDFGTGYSSLSYLKNLPINNLKIDRAFIKDLQNDENDQQIVQTLITMAHSLNMSVIAEGVEEIEQFNLLNQYACDEIQGYLLSKPVADSEFLEMLRNPQKFTSLFQQQPALIIQR
jgi:diguanylate cyclase (GGDEF)-like protein/PAS domain S-box-containing protein